MFNFNDFNMRTAETENGVARFEVDPEDLYTKTIAHIRSVLSGESEAPELKESKYMISLARSVPESAWDDALLARDQFIDVPFAAFSFEGKPNEDMMGMLDPSIEPHVRQMVNRGWALETARKWFTRALGHAHGPCILHITAGVNGSRSFRL